MTVAKSPSKQLCVLAMLVGWLACAGAYADLVTATFEGPMTRVDMPSTPPGNPFTIGDIMQLVIAYDSDAPDLYPLPDPLRSICRDVYSVTVSVRTSANVVIYAASSTGADGRFLIKDEDPREDMFVDTLTFLDESAATGGSGDLTGPDILGMPLWALALGGTDWHCGGGPLSSDALPTSFTPADWDTFAMSLSWQLPLEANPQILATVLAAETTIVPLPGALLLGGLGMATVGWLRRRRA